MSQQVIMVNTRGFTSVYNAMQKFADARHLGAVIKRSWSASARDIVKPEVKQHVRTTFGGKKNLASSYGAHVTGTQPFDLRMDVTSRLKMAIPHEFGGTITAKRSENLAIPTKYAIGMGLQSNVQKFKGKKAIKYKGTRTTKLRPKHLNWESGLFFYRGNKLFMKVDKEQGRTRKIQKRGFRSAGSSITNKEITAIPLFVMLKSVRLRKRTNVTSLFKLRLLPRITARTEKNLEEEFMRISAMGSGKP